MLLCQQSFSRAFRVSVKFTVKSLLFQVDTQTILSYHFFSSRIINSCFVNFIVIRNFSRSFIKIETVYAQEKFGQGFQAPAANSCLFH